MLQAEAQLLLFYFTPYVLNIFRTLIYPSSRAWDYSVELSRWSYCSVKNREFSISIRLWYVVVCVWCDVLRQIVAVGSRVSVDTDCYRVFCFVIVVFSCAFYVLFLDWQCFFNPLTPKDPYSGRTAPLTSICCILYIYATNTGTEYIKHGIYSPFFPLQNAICFIWFLYY